MDFATGLHEQAAVSVLKAQDRVSAAESDLRVAQAVLRDAKLANDKEAISMSEAAVAESRLGVADAQRLLQRARALLAERERSVQEMRLWATSNRPVGALVVPVEGEVRVRKQDGSYRAAVLGSAQAGDRFETSAGGRARLFVADGDGEIALQGDSAFTVVRDDVVSGFLGELEYGYGRFVKSIKGKIARKFEVRTPSVAIAVRGTRFDVEVRSGSSLIKVTEGVVEVTPRKGAEVVEIAAGWQRHYLEGQGFLPPEKLGAKKGE